MIIIGIMGWIGLPVNIATAMLASVSMGSSVDFSIYYLYCFCRERAIGADFYQSLHIAHGSAGQAMVFTNVALIVGFSVLISSSFIPTVHIGIQ